MPGDYEGRAARVFYRGPFLHDWAEGQGIHRGLSPWQFTVAMNKRLGTDFRELDDPQVALDRWLELIDAEGAG